MTDPCTKREKRAEEKRQERANRDAGLIFVHGRWFKPEDAARIQRAMDDAAAEVASIRASVGDE